jgi:hypothetical protein
MRHITLAHPAIQILMGAAVRIPCITRTKPLAIVKTWKIQIPLK